MRAFHFFAAKNFFLLPRGEGKVALQLRIWRSVLQCIEFLLYCSMNKHSNMCVWLKVIACFFPSKSSSKRGDSQRLTFHLHSRPASMEHRRRRRTCTVKGAGLHYTSLGPRWTPLLFQLSPVLPPSPWRYPGWLEWYTGKQTKLNVRQRWIQIPNSPRGPLCSVTLTTSLYLFLRFWIFKIERLLGEWR